jgi:hypothetical protein
VDRYRRKLDVLTLKTEQAEGLTETLRTETDRLSKEIQRKEAEISIMRKDLDTIGEKLVDELERRAELQHSKDAVQEELEELTRSLFEEANSMVASEARERHRFETQEQTLKKQIDQLKTQLQMEQAQLRELKLRMEQQTVENHKLRKKNLQQTPTRIITTPLKEEPVPFPDDAIDPSLLSQFQEFIDQSPKLKLNKIHSLTYMKYALDEDVLSCLRFGASPKISARKLIDPIVSNTCYVEEMSAAQIEALEKRDEAIAASNTNLAGSNRKLSEQTSKRLDVDDSEPETEGKLI